MEKKERPLNQRQKEFCLHYANCGNASEAARRAGYKGAPNRIGTQLLSNLVIQAEIKRLTRKKEKSIASNSELREFWTSMLRDPEADPKDRLKASELIGKTRGMFLERREISGNASVVMFPVEGKKP